MVQLYGFSTDDATLEDLVQFCNAFPHYKLKDKIFLRKGSDVTNAFIRDRYKSAGFEAGASDDHTGTSPLPGGLVDLRQVHLAITPARIPITRRPSDFGTGPRCP
nr:uncharacterized protein LOC117281112 isoform X4 [Nicotiana tomentosiformis]